MLNIGETETESHFRIRVSTERLLSRLIAHHDYAVPNLKLPEVLLVPNPEPKPLPPIPNKEIEAACKVAFPPNVGQIEAIQRAVLAEFPKMTMADLKSQRRTAPVVYVRQLAMYVAKTLTLRSLPEIGRRFGGRDHTTVLHAVRKIDRLLLTDMVLAGRFRNICETLGEMKA